MFFNALYNFLASGVFDLDIKAVANFLFDRSFNCWVLIALSIPGLTPPIISSNLLPPAALPTDRDWETEN